MKNIPTVLTIAGSDSGGGAGIQADLKTFLALSVYGYTAVTSVTAQNTMGIYGNYELPGNFVYKQIEAAAHDTEIDAAKTGMLSNADIVANVAKAIRDFKIKNLVVDPVIRAKDGSSLLKDNALETFVTEIVPLALVITPNIYETEILTGAEVKSVDDMEQSAEKISKLGAEVVVVKGGHLPKDGKVIDVIYINGPKDPPTGLRPRRGSSTDLGREKFEYLEYPYIRTRNTHGIGCTFSAGIAANLAKGYDALTSIKSARDYVQGALQNELKVGKGWGPLNHGWAWQE